MPLLTTTKKLKIWTIITHALIIVGAGHGVFFFFLIELIWLPYITKNNFSFSFSTADNHFPTIGLLMLLGQAALIISILHQKQNTKNLFHLIGICLLWLGIIYFIHDTNKNTNIHFGLITSIPFAICTLVTFLGHSLKRFYDWIIDK